MYVLYVYAQQVLRPTGLTRYRGSPRVCFYSMFLRPGGRTRWNGSRFNPRTRDLVTRGCFVLVVSSRLMAASAAASLFVVGDLALRRAQEEGGVGVCRLVCVELCACVCEICALPVAGRPSGGPVRSGEGVPPRAATRLWIWTRRRRRSVSPASRNSIQSTRYVGALGHPWTVPSAAGGIGAVWAPAGWLERAGRLQDGSQARGADAQSQRRRSCRPESKTRPPRSGGVTARAAAGKRTTGRASSSAAEGVLLDSRAARVLGDALV